MDALRFAGLAVAASILAVTVKSFRPEMGIQVTLAGGITLLIIAVSEFSGIADTFKNSLPGLGVDGESLALVFKVVGLTYITQLASDVCRDSGETALASKTEICGRLMIAAAALPTFISVAKTVTDLINEYV